MTTPADAIPPGKKSLKDAHPHVAAEWHPTRNGSLTPDQMTPVPAARSGGSDGPIESAHAGAMSLRAWQSDPDARRQIRDRIIQEVLEQLRRQVSDLAGEITDHEADDDEYYQTAAWLAVEVEDAASVLTTFYLAKAEQAGSNARQIARAVGQGDSGNLKRKYPHLAAFSRALVAAEVTGQPIPVDGGRKRPDAPNGQYPCIISPPATVD